MSIRIKRVYDEPEPSDGFRVLVDRLWPRGLSKEKADVDRWVKEVAPSQHLRTWFGHVPEKFDEFTARYRAELDGNPVVAELREIISSHESVTLLYGARDVKANQAVVLLDYLESAAEQGGESHV